MIEVKIRDKSDEAFVKGLKKFKKLCNKDGFLRAIRERRYFKKPNEVKREKRKKAERLKAKMRNHRTRQY